MEGSQPVSQIPSEPAVKRSKFLWRVFLVTNFALGGGSGGGSWAVVVAVVDPVGGDGVLSVSVISKGGTWHFGDMSRLGEKCYTYMFAQSGKKERTKEKSRAPAEVSSIPAAVTAPPQEEPVISPPISRPVIERQPIPEDQQRELFQWMLEEKRKVKPVNRQEKKRIDEEKAILKEYIRSKSIPRI